MSDPGTDKFITPHEAAKRLGVSIRTVWRWIASGKLPSVHYGEEGGIGSGPRGVTLIPTEPPPDSAGKPLTPPAAEGSVVPGSDGPP